MAEPSEERRQQVTNEQLQSDLKKVLEYVVDVPQIKDDVAQLKEDVTEVKLDLKIIKEGHGGRIRRLEDRVEG